MRMKNYLDRRYREVITELGLTDKTVKSNGSKFAIEKKYLGCRATVHKKGTKIKLYDSNGTDITYAFPSIAGQAKSISKDDYVLDCEIVLFSGKNALHRELVNKYIQTTLSGSEVNDTGFVFYAFDCPYFNGDISQKQWVDRKKTLHSLSYTSNIREVGSVIVDNYVDGVKVLEMFAKMPASGGAVIKKIDSVYGEKGDNNRWVMLNTEGFM